MKIRHGLAVITVLGLGVLASACERENKAVGTERPATGTTPGAQPGMQPGAQPGMQPGAPGAAAPTNVPEARKQLIAARCAHEERCGNVGANKKFTSRDVCMNQVSNKIESYLHADRCKTGVASTQLQQCVATINAHGCDKSLDDLNDIDACREKTLCVGD